MIIDLHCDTLVKLYYNPSFHLYDAPTMVNIKKLQESNYLLQCFAMFVDYLNDPFLETYKTL